PLPPGPSPPLYLQRPGRVKRRKTKRERNSAKFGRDAAGGPGGRMLQRMPALGWSSHCAGHAKSSPLPAIERVFVSMPVIITQHRLSQHLGMFNREVKSADIERLLGPRSEQETETETSAAIPGAISQAWDPCAPGQPSPLDEKENVPPSGAEPGGATAAMKELAQELQTHLDLTSTFPGRNLISERRQTILSTLLDRHQTLPDLSALMVHNKLCGGSAQGGKGLWPRVCGGAGQGRPASVEPVRAPTFYQPWDSRAAAPRTWDLPEASGEGCPRAEGWESEFPLGGAQELCALQQLPMSFFPPSEALEHGRSPPPTLHGYWLEEGSPEAWVFPRMKLY
uniref:Uncharacterized protein n=1 Tax=Chelonoidis abingdonii TaxID=106734 RepID=A0A8C0J4E8_CHEAB